MQKNDFAQIFITDLTNKGEGIGRVDGYTLFVKDALPGDTVRARITRPKKNYAYARTEEVLTPSPDRVAAPCVLARPCGGCTLQALSYEKQLQWKETFVKRNLCRIGGFSQEEVENKTQRILGAASPLRYRNKAQYPVGMRFDETGRGHLVAGYYAARTHSLLPVEDCLLSPAHHRALLKMILDFGDTHGWTAYDESTGTGMLRHILIRDGFASGEIMVCFVINGRTLPGEEELVTCLRSVEDIGARITSICKNVNTKNTNVILGEEVLPIFGEAKISDRLCGLTFSISPLSFYQVNHAQTERLYGVVKEMAGLHGTEKVLDLFCGIGTIALYLSDAAASVTGVEIVPQAIADAKENAAANGITNADFYAGAAEELIRDGRFAGADVVVLDPPRKGCAEKLLTALRQLAPSRIIYVSCDSATLARDLALLCAEAGEGEAKYEIKVVQPVDLFPQGCHCEVVVSMSRVGSKQ